MNRQFVGPFRLAAALSLGAVSLLLLLGTMMVVSAQEDNMLENQGFEEPNPANWESKDGGWWYWSYSWPLGTAHSGDRSVGIDVRVNWYENGWWQSTPPVTITARESYTFSGWIRTDRVANQAVLTLMFLDGDGREVMTRNSNAVSGSTDWVHVHPPEPVVAPVDAVAARIRCQLFGTGKAWFDDILLRPEPTDLTVLEIEKGAQPAGVKAGDLLTYTLSFSNTGNILAEDVIITDSLPLSVTLASSDPTADDQPDPHILVWDESINDLPPDGVSYTITVVVTTSNTIANEQWLTNTVTIAAENAISRTASITTEVTPCPVLVVEKQSRADLVSVNDTLYYNVTYKNVGGAIATGVWLTDSLPISTTLDWTSQPTDTQPNAHTLAWNLGDLSAAEGEKSIFISVKVDPSAQGQVLTNCAELKNNESSDNDCKLVGVNPIPDLRLDPPFQSQSLTLTSSLPHTLTYQWVLSNTNIFTDVVDGIIPTSSQGWDWEVVTPSLPLELPPGESEPVQVRTVLSDTLQIDMPRVTDTLSIDVTSIYSSDVEATAVATTTVLFMTDLELEKDAEPSTVKAGERLTYTLTYSNTGNFLAEGVVITDDLPPSVTLASSDPTPDEQPDPHTLVWDESINDLPPDGAPYIITVVVTVSNTITDGQCLTNTATLAAENAVSRTASITTEVTRPVLVVEKASSADLVSVNDTLYYTLTYRNEGGAIATGVWLTDSLPSGVTYVPPASVPPTHYISASKQLVWALPPLAATGEEETIVITVTVDPSAQGQVLTNCVELRNAESSDSDCEPVGVNPIIPALSLDPPFQSQSVTITSTLPYTITYQWMLSNTNIFTDVVDGIILASSQAWNWEVVTPSLPLTLSPGESEPVQVRTVLSDTLQIDMPRVTDTLSIDVTSIYSSDVEATAVATTTVLFMTDLELEKDAEPSTVKAGERLTYTLTYSNTGSCLAEGVVITDSLPLSVTLASSDPWPDAQPDSHILVWDESIGDLPANGEPNTITVVVTVSNTITDGQWLTNTATLAAENAVSRTASITTEVTRPVLVVEKASSADLVSVNDTLYYTLTYRNEGGAIATGVWLTDSLPISVTMVSSNPQANYRPDPHTLIWLVGDLEATGEEESIVVIVTVDPSAQGGVLTNCAELKSGEVSTSDCKDIHVEPIWFIYMPVVMRDYCFPLMNGGFENGWTGWTRGGELNQSVSPNNPHSGSFSALLGDPAYNCKGGVPQGSAWMEQTFLVPNTASPTLSFRYNIFTHDKNSVLSDTYDSFDVKINGSLVHRDMNTTDPYGCDNLRSLDWRQPETPIDLSSHAGSCITLRFENWNRYDGWYNTWTYIDDIQVIP